MELIPVLLVIAIQWLFLVFILVLILTFSTPEHSTGAHPEASESFVYSKGAQKQGSVRQTGRKAAAYTQVERCL